MPTMAISTITSQKVFDLVTFRIIFRILFKISVAGVEERKAGSDRAELEVRKLLKYTGVFIVARLCARSETAAVTVAAIRFFVEKITVTGIDKQAVSPDTVVAKDEAVLLSIWNKRGHWILEYKHAGAVGLQLQGLAKHLMRARLVHRVVEIGLSLSTRLLESGLIHANGAIERNKIVEVHAAREWL